jgi:hypothetical protein
VDLGVAINVTEKDTMLRLDLREVLIHTPTILHLADRSNINPKGVLEDTIVYGFM